MLSMKQQVMKTNSNWVNENIVLKNIIDVLFI